MSDNIPPFDLQVEIMKRLPVKSLLQFRSVSKAWRSVIDSSKFISNYHRGTQQHHLLVSYSDPEKNESIYSDPENESQRKYVSIVDDDTFPKQKLPLTLPLSVNILKRRIFAGSSQGLFCFYDSLRKTAVIWNPSIRKSVSISLPLPVLGGPPYDIDVAFGVCPDTCDPKLVKVTYDRSLRRGDTVVEVFSLSTKAWKRLTTNLPRKSIRFTKKKAVTDGFIYWLALDTHNGVFGYQGYTRIIISFDMITEEFKELDTSALDPESSDLIISKVRESLVVVQIRSEDEKSVASVWMMDDNDPKLFTKQFIIKTPNGINVVHGFRRNGEPIFDMVEDDPNNVDLFVYESDSEHINRIGITVVPQLLINVNSYMETLLLLDH